MSLDTSNKFVVTPRGGDLVSFEIHGRQFTVSGDEAAQLAIWLLAIGKIDWERLKRAWHEIRTEPGPKQETLI